MRRFVPALLAAVVVTFGLATGASAASSQSVRPLPSPLTVTCPPGNDCGGSGGAYQANLNPGTWTESYSFGATDPYTYSFTGSWTVKVNSSTSVTYETISGSNAKSNDQYAAWGPVWITDNEGNDGYVTEPDTCGPFKDFPSFSWSPNVTENDGITPYQSNIMVYQPVDSMDNCPAPDDPAVYPSSDYFLIFPQ